MKLLRVILLLVVMIGGTSCNSMKPREFANAKPLFDPTQFFTGQTNSTGVMENRRGAPQQIVTTQTMGRWVGNSLHLEQNLAFSGGKKQHRSWQLRRLDAHHFEGRANDVSGPIRGEAYGNVFHWSFILMLSPGNPLMNVRMSQWMYLQPDGRTMLNHSTITKWGVVVSQVTEQFSKN